MKSSALARRRSRLGGPRGHAAAWPAAVLLLLGGCATPPPPRPRSSGRWSAAGAEAPKQQQTPPKARVEALARRLTAVDCQLRADAARALKQQGIAARAAIPALIASLKDATCDIEPAVETLDGLRSALAAHVPALIDCMQADVGQGSWACADLLARMGAPALPHLDKLVAGPPSTGRNLAVYALGRLGSAGLPRLMALLQLVCEQRAAARGTEVPSDERHFHNQVVDALGAIGGPALHRVRTLWRADAQRHTRGCVVWVVAEMIAAHSAPDPRARELIAELLRDAARDRDPRLRRKAQATLRSLEQDRGEPSP